MNTKIYLKTDNKSIESRLKYYPAKARKMADKIRSLIHKTAEREKVGPVEESLKWGEPSFSVKNGSPVRMDWKKDSPDKFYIFFVCHTSLVETFRINYLDQLSFEGNRAIVLSIEEALPESILSHCFSLALQYHSLKNLPLLGA